MKEMHSRLIGAREMKRLLLSGEYRTEGSVMFPGDVGYVLSDGAVIVHDAQTNYIAWWSSKAALEEHLERTSYEFGYLFNEPPGSILQDASTLDSLPEIIRAAYTHLASRCGVSFGDPFTEGALRSLAACFEEGDYRAYDKSDSFLSFAWLAGNYWVEKKRATWALSEGYAPTMIVAVLPDCLEIQPYLALSSWIETGHTSYKRFVTTVAGHL